MKNILKRTKRLIIDNKEFFFTLLILTIYGFIVCLSKRTFHDDEPLSFTLANKIGGWVTYIGNEGWFDKEVFAHYGVTDNPFTFGNVYMNQFNDVHPPLWYGLIHLISSFFPYKFSIWFAMIINLISYIFNLVIIYLLINRYTNKKWLACLAMALYGININIIDGLIFLRMYQLVSSFSLLFIYFATKIVDSEKDEWKWFILTALTVLLGGLTHYYFYLFAVMASLIFLIVLLVRKRFITLIKAVISVVTPMCLNILILFPAFFRQFFGVGGKSSDNGAAIRDNLANKIVGIDNIIHGLKDSWCGLTIGIVIIVLFVYYFIKKRNKKTNTIVLLLIPCFLFMVFVYTFGMFADRRYLVIVDIISICSTVVLFNECLNSKIVIGLMIVTMLLTQNFKTVITKLNTQSSWSFAKENKDKNCVVINQYDMAHYYISTSFYDFMGYKDVAMVYPDNVTLINDIKEDFIMYIDKSLNQEEVLGYVSDSANNSFTYELKENIPTTQFNIYYCTYKPSK